MFPESLPERRVAMRRLIRQLIENMTYQDLSGRRRPPRYVVAAGLLFLAMIPTAC
jgi:hypothetical protein